MLTFIIRKAQNPKKKTYKVQNWNKKLKKNIFNEFTSQPYHIRSKDKTLVSNVAAREVVIRFVCRVANPKLKWGITW